MIERFKPAGHKSIELSEIVMPEEVFKPIQRVIDKSLYTDDKTIGYLFRDIEYKKGVVADVVVTKRLLNAYLNVIEINSEEWKQYQETPQKNPLGWLPASGPVVMELMYRSIRDKTPLGTEMDGTWKELFYQTVPLLSTSTTIQCEDGPASIKHGFSDTSVVPFTEESTTRLNGDMSPNTEQFLRALLGRRYKSTTALFGRYRWRIELEAPRGKGHWRLNIGRASKIFSINAGIRNDIRWPARCIAPFSNFPQYRYEVRDD